jgi:hypothetical protein
MKVCQDEECTEKQVEVCVVQQLILCMSQISEQLKQCRNMRQLGMSCQWGSRCSWDHSHMAGMPHPRQLPVSASMLSIVTSACAQKHVSRANRRSRVKCSSESETVEVSESRACDAQNLRQHVTRKSIWGNGASRFRRLPRPRPRA